jgi:hypothetical protein
VAGISRRDAAKLKYYQLIVFSEHNDMTEAVRSYRVPEDFFEDRDFGAERSESEIEFRFDWADSATVLNELNNALIIQRFLTAFSAAKIAKFVWSDAALNSVKINASTSVLLCCAICLDEVVHLGENLNELRPSALNALREKVEQSRLEPDWFSESSGVVCADYISRGWHSNLYSSQGVLRNRGDIEDLLNPIIMARVEGLHDAELIKKWKDSLVSVVYELFENTHVHARFDLDGSTIKKNVIRTLIVRGTKEFTGGNSKKILPREYRDCLEISVLDSGIGFYGSAFKKSVSKEVDLGVEWLNVRKCMEKHVDEEAPSNSHRGMGLYEVLRALYFLKGAIQIRSGNTFGYRSFFPGDFQLQMEAKNSKQRPGLPKSRLLDFIDPYRPSPTRNTLVTGIVAKTIVPLVWS